ncbi:MAG: ribonuclease III [Gammaproteobacteria bacterium]|nr:ribonuclease III [Gammaproteobacteria bacterium]
MTDSLDNLQHALGYSFNKIEYLEQALTHRSVGPVNNERLEYLGDSVLNFCITRRLFGLRPDANEGDLSRIRASLVNREALASIATALDLSANIRLGRGEKQSGGQRRASIQSDAVEAILGAVLLDGGFDVCSALIDRLYQSHFEYLPDAQDLKDPKTRLQEYLQSRGLGLPCYTVTSETGKDHARNFEVSCEAAGYKTVQGMGSSRRKAEQAAASKMLEQLENV